MTFGLFPFRFTFEALDPLSFPPGAAANAFRGAFGHIFRRIACVPGCPGAAACEIREQCAYARLFEPACLDGPSGLADAPRPFVIRAGSLDGQSHAAGEAFFIDIHLFDLREPALAYFVLAFQELAREGIGAARGRVQLVRVAALDAARRPGAPVYEAGRFLPGAHPGLLQLPLEIQEAAEPRSLVLRFATPTELKSEGVILRDAPFHIVVARARDRIATLSELYGGGSLDIDFRGIAERARQVETIASSLRWESHQRKSSRTQQVHPLGGFVGEVRYAGDLREFLPFLQAAYWTGIGRQTVWGKGSVEIVSAS